MHLSCPTPAIKQHALTDSYAGIAQVGTLPPRLLTVSEMCDERADVFCVGKKPVYPSMTLEQWGALDWVESL